MQVGHAKPLRLGVHALHKGVLRAAHILADRHGDVIGRPDQHHLDALSSVMIKPGLKPILVGGSAAACAVHLDRRSERQFAGGNRTEGDVGRHQFGERGGIPALKSLLVLEHLAGGEVEQDSGLATAELANDTPASASPNKSTCREWINRIIYSDWALPSLPEYS